MSGTNVSTVADKLSGTMLYDAAVCVRCLSVECCAGYVGMSDFDVLGASAAGAG